MSLIFRDLSGMAEFLAAEDLQRQVWGAGDLPDPADLMMVIQAEGGLTGGAFQDGRLIGYVFGFPTRAPEVQHSHRLAVLPEARGQNIGRRLKLYQRDWCLSRGITMARWTFDPMRAPNAALNITRLGARVRNYHVDYYGAMAGINRGIPSDRLLAEWALDAPHVAALAAGQTAAPVETPRRIRIPAAFEVLKRDDPTAAQAAQLQVRHSLQAAFAEGLTILDYDIATRDYLLG